MPTRGLRPSLARTHSRSSSGGSSKVVLNLQLTQKDPVQSKIDKARRTSHTLEPTARVNVSRTGSTVHVQQREREQVTSAAPRRPANLHPSRGGRPKAGFTIAESTIGSDEDEWISSESGAATPLDETSGEEGSGKKTPQESSPATPVDPVGQRAKGQGPALVPSTTPRAEPAPPRPRVQTNGFVPTRPPHVPAPAARISSPPEPSQYPQQEWGPYRQQPKQLHAPPSHLSRQLPIHLHLPEQAVSQSPPHTPEAGPSARPPSTRSLIADHALRPHPLIRGQSFGHGHLAPLKVSSDAAQAQLSSSPPPGRAPSTSPTSIRTIQTPPQAPSPGKHFTSAIFRRSSTSSAHSAATLPVQPLTPVERGRTLSTLSTASSSACTLIACPSPHARRSVRGAECVPCGTLSTPESARAS
ncbi:hypothetical protein BC826DRAFT_972210 [Russula brevipes]|nr:hypothetical protein BC826DRAFT_972210 [Russula brevipes]